MVSFSSSFSVAKLRVRTLFFIRKKIIEATFTRFVEARKKGA
jgi:hypothetical protein